MKKSFFYSSFFIKAFLLTVGHRLLAQTIPVNYDEVAIPAYTLPDPLTALNGKKISNINDWQNLRRPEIMQLFAEHVYGKMPAKTVATHFETTSTTPNALNGLATRQEITISFPEVSNAPRIYVLVYLPNGAVGKVPAFLGLNFCGNQCISPDSTIRLSGSYAPDFCRGFVKNQATEASRASQADRWPVEMLIKQGFAVATAHYGDLEPDFSEGWKTGIRGTMAEELGLQPAEWSAIGAWAWGLSRIMDWIVQTPALNAKEVALVGHSRLGKAALWAGATDQRFGMVISNNSGEGGAALAKREFGETVKHINTTFPHWFVEKFKTYNQNTAALPVDQHLLLSLIAPRPLYVASAQDDRWADPKGEFLATQATAPVYELYGKTGLKTSEMPPVDQPTGNGSVRYHIRTGKHDITRYDWEQYVQFVKELWP